jgi:hypothetical protein
VNPSNDGRHFSAFNLGGCEDPRHLLWRHVGGCESLYEGKQVESFLQAEECWSE